MMLFFAGGNLQSPRGAEMMRVQFHPEKMTQTLRIRLSQGRRQSEVKRRDFSTDIDIGVKRSLIKKTKCQMVNQRTRGGDRGQ